MALTLKEFRESGLLELYVLDDLSDVDRQTVEEFLMKYPELKKDQRQIENALEVYAEVHSVQPSSAVWENIRTHKSIDGFFRLNKRLFFSYLTIAALSAGIIGALFILNNLNTRNLNLEERLVDCEDNRAQYAAELLLFEQITNEDNQIVLAQPTDKYPNTNIFLYNNPTEGKTYLQLNALPEIASNQSYQLWSLQDDIDPIPLDVFDGQTRLIEVRHESNSNAYAITIEPLGGSQSPTLEELIGVFPVG